MAVGDAAGAKRRETAKKAVELALQRSCRPQLLDKSPSGGLTQIPRGGSATREALTCLGTPQDVALADPPSPSISAQPKLLAPALASSYALWVSDEGWLYTPSLHHHWNIPLDRLLIVRAPEPMEVWRLALDAIQTGLFRWALLRPSKLCSTGQLRKLQLTAEASQCQVIVVSGERLPHWVLRKKLYAQSPLPSPLEPSSGVQRSLPRPFP